MLSEKLQQAINDQINFEFESAQIYVAMAAYCTEQDLDGFANFFLVQAEEERFHAMKFYGYLAEQGGRVTISGTENPKNEYESILEVFNAALDHERKVTKRIYNIMDIALEEREHATKSFLNWFVDEQVEEEATMMGLIKKIERVGENQQGIFMMDEELAKRTFTAPQA